MPSSVESWLLDSGVSEELTNLGDDVYWINVCPERPAISQRKEHIVMYIVIAI